jgi:hypothetical protein
VRACVLGCVHKMMEGLCGADMHVLACTPGLKMTISAQPAASIGGYSSPIYTPNTPPI